MPGSSIGSGHPPGRSRLETAGSALEKTAIDLNREIDHGTARIRSALQDMIVGRKEGRLGLAFNIAPHLSNGMESVVSPEAMLFGDLRLEVGGHGSG